MKVEFWKQRYEYFFRWWRHIKSRWELFSLGLLLLLAVAVWPVPQWMVRHEYWEWASHPDDYAKLVDDYRKTLVQIIGGAFLLYTLYLTQRRTKATEETLRVSQRTLEVTQETQITDRFTKAITQLGATDSQGQKQLEIRFGGIYALERIAKDSPHDHGAIMEILTAYIRQNSPWPESQSENAAKQVRKPDKDIQAVITVIGRRHREQDKEGQQLNLAEVDLGNTDLREAHLEGAILQGAHLEGAILQGAHLEGARLQGAHLERATLQGAYLERANLHEVHLEGADLRAAHLEGAILEDVHLEGADLYAAHLEGAILVKSDVTQTQIDYAFGDYTTKLPPELTHPENWPKAPSQQDTTT